MDRLDMNLGVATDEGQQLDLYEVFERLLLRRWLIIGVFCAILGPSLLVVYTLPVQYRSEALILVESQQIPTDFVMSTITGVAAERIQLIEKKVLTRRNILEIVEKYGLYPDLRKVDAYAAVESFRRNTGLGLISANASGRNNTTIAFNLFHFASTPVLAQNVTNELVTLFLNENARTRTERAAQATSFLSDEAEKLQGAIQLLEDRLTSFKSENRQSLPELMGANITLLEDSKKQLQTEDQGLYTLKAEYRDLEAQIALLRQGSTPEDGQSLGELRRRYSEFLIDNLETHPTAIAMKRRLDELSVAAEETQGSLPAETSDGSIVISGDPQVMLVERRLNGLQERINYVEQRREDILLQIQRLDSYIVASPAVEQEYNEMERDLANLSLSYEQTRRNVMSARMAESLESDQKGERFSLLEPPVVPTDAARPNRPKWFGLSIFAGLVASLGLALAIDLFRRGLHGRRSFGNALGMQPLVLVPFIDIPEESAGRDRRLMAVGGGLLLLLTLVLSVVHFYVTGLDVMWFALLRRLGI